MITIKQATCTDGATVEAVLHEIDCEFIVPLSERTPLDVLAQKFLAHGIVYVAYDDERPVGLIAFYANDLNSKIGYLSVIGLLPTHRRKGIGRQLLDAMIQTSKLCGMTAITLMTDKINHSAVAMYERTGFVSASDYSHPTRLKMVKEL